MNNTELQYKKFFPFRDKNAFIALEDHMGNDNSIIRAARTSYGKDREGISKLETELFGNIIVSHEECLDELGLDAYRLTFPPGEGHRVLRYSQEEKDQELYNAWCAGSAAQQRKDRGLIRRLMNDQHTSPFEMVEFVFLVQVPMDCWRQWIRHRTANVNEYSTRYSEALDMFQVTEATEWRLQSKDNKQGSSGYLTEWPEDWRTENPNIVYTPQQPIDISRSNCKTPGDYLTSMEESLHEHAKIVYQERLKAGIAREQARKDLPLSTYTRAYWKCDLHNILNFLRLRMASDAQLEIRNFANCMHQIVRQICPVTCEAFDDYVTNGCRFSRMEMEIIREMFKFTNNELNGGEIGGIPKPDSMTDNEWTKFLAKLAPQ